MLPEEIRNKDRQDPLRHYRDQFFFPQHNGKDIVYFCGNSLGLMPKKALDYYAEEGEKWATKAVEGHFTGVHPWMSYHEMLAHPLAKLCGAHENEVGAMGSLTSNLHHLFATFYRPHKQRYKILTEAGAFSSDAYLVESQLKLHGYSSEAWLEVKPREGEFHITEDDVLAAISQAGDSLAVVFLGGVNYYTGQVFDLKKITEAAHSVGAYAGYDLAHAISNVPLHLHDDQVDFAAWCGYKYLNGGPGCTGGIFVHEKHGLNPDTPREAGWWGYRKSDRFEMKAGYVPQPGAEGWMLSNAPVMNLQGLRASLELIQEVSLDDYFAKAKALNNYALAVIKENTPADRLRVITPKQEYGCQISMYLEEGCAALHGYLREQGIITDERKPGVVRIAPVPLYNSFADVWQLGQALRAFFNK